MYHSASATSNGAQGNFSKSVILNSVHSKETNEVCLGFLVKIFHKSPRRGDVDNIMVGVGQRLDLHIA